MKKGMLILFCLFFLTGNRLSGQNEKIVFHNANQLSITLKTGKTFPVFRHWLKSDMEEAGFDATLTESVFFFSSTTNYPVMHRANYLLGVDLTYSFKPNLSAGLYFEKGPNFWLEGIYDKPDAGAFLDIHYLDYKIGTMVKWHTDHFTFNLGPVFAISKTYAEIPVYVGGGDPPLPIPGFIIPDPDHHNRISQKTAFMPGIAGGFDIVFPKESRKMNFVAGSRAYVFYGNSAFGPYDAPAFTRAVNGDFYFIDPIEFPEVNMLLLQATFHIGLRVNLPVKPKE